MRPISPTLQAIQDSTVRFPDYKVYAWNADEVTMSQIASSNGNFDPAIPEPIDLTPYVTNLSWSLKQITFELVDNTLIMFHPDYGLLKNYLKNNSIIRLVEGDERIDESNWPITFTGQIHGQIGWTKNRSTQKFSGKVTVLNRAETLAYKKRQITSREYTVGTDIAVALYDICHEFMGLTDREIRIPQPLGRQFLHKTNQLSQVTPWDGISALLEVVCYVPFFDGEGKLAYMNKNFQREPNRLMLTNEPFAEYDIPERTQDYVNKVIVTFIDASLTRVDSANQKLSTAEVTTGFFSMHESLQCWWSEDRKQRAAHTYMVVLKSVNSGLLPVGTESYVERDDFHGTIEVEISVWVAILATAMIAVYVAAALIPDRTTPTVISVPGIGTELWAMGGGVVFDVAEVTGVITVNPTSFFQWTISVGRVIQAAALVAILLIMMSIGSAQYEIWGQPFEYAFLEKKSIAQEDGLDSWEIVELEIKNDFIGTFDQADTVSATELIYQKTMAAPRRISIRDDLTLEMGDIIVISDGRKINITDMSKSIKRGEVSTLLLEGGRIMSY